MAARLTAPRAVALLKAAQPPVPAAAVPTSRLAPPIPPTPAHQRHDLLPARPPPSSFAARIERVRELGRGGQGVVHEVSRGTDERFALKRVRIAADQSHALREARMMRALPAHAHVLRFFGSWVEDGESESDEGSASDDESLTSCSLEPVSRPAPRATRATLHLLIELARDDLARRLARAPPLARGEVAAARSHIAAGLAHVHAHSIAHRDLKPANVLLAGDDAAPVWKLADFGLAIDESEALRARAGVGTPAYTDPALRGVLVGARREAQLEPAAAWRAFLAADVYALGVIALELAHPFATAMERAVVLGAYRASGALPRVVSAADAALVRWLTNLDASTRPTAAVLAQHFEAVAT